MSGITYDYMESYIRDLIPEKQGVLKGLKDFAESNSVPIVQKETANLLEFFMSLKKPERVLELGTAIGYSAILMAEASNRKAIIDTVERDPNMILMARENVKKHDYDKNINIIEGDCLEVLEKLQGQYDIIFMDAGKGHYNHFLPHCLRLLKADGIIIADNVLFRGMVASKDLVKRRKITIVKRMRSYLELVSKDETLITSVLPMGDGIALTKRRNE
ncbi:O-methyltransferase [Desnuesiella massiliensis]|uniref:O-methyltransferase n=1 Tax=Desnuesiella massiliensis TaxID=1650662 RepID=UPI0006E2D750|nr:O-methyltransferase [Desnuesiella massiliensis]